MKKILMILLILMAVMPLSNAASVSPELKDPWLPDDYIALESFTTTDSNYYLVDPWDSHSAEEECVQAGGCEGYSSYKVDNWKTTGMDGTYAGTITISKSTAYTFDWSSTQPVCKVIVVAGGVANVYSYPPNTMSDTGLVAPLNTNTDKIPDDTFEISHVTFCYGNGGTQEIPEFPTVALPIAALLGLAFVFMRRKN